MMDHQRLSKRPAFFGLAVLMLVLTGFSSTKLAYRYADWGVVWWVEDYVNLTGEQKATLTCS